MSKVWKRHVQYENPLAGAGCETVLTLEIFEKIRKAALPAPKCVLVRGRIG